MVAPRRCVWRHMTAVAQHLIERSMEYEPKQILTSGSDSKCLHEIRRLKSPQLLVRSVLSVNTVNIASKSMSPMNLSSEFTIVIPRLPCLFNMASAASATIQLVNSVTSDSVNSFNFAICAFASNCVPIELVPCSDGWRRT